MTEIPDRMHATFLDESLPLPARLGAARHLVLRLTAELEAVKQQAKEAVAAAELDDDLTATLYWEFDDLVPLALLGRFHELQELLAERCPWTYACPTCGVDQRLTSRTALKDFQAFADGKRPHWTATRFACPACWERIHSQRSVEWGRQQDAHRARLRELKTMPYREYLKTPEWQERRKARLKAARYACQVCNTRNVTLNVHHRTYVRRGEEFARDLIVLCEGCHHLFHRNGSLAPHDEADR